MQHSRFILLLYIINKRGTGHCEEKTSDITCAASAQTAL
jgi:hypothetical protein